MERVERDVLDEEGPFDDVDGTEAVADAQQQSQHLFDTLDEVLVHLLDKIGRDGIDFSPAARMHQYLSDAERFLKQIETGELSHQDGMEWIATALSRLADAAIAFPQLFTRWLAEKINDPAARAHERVQFGTGDGEIHEAIEDNAILTWQEGSKLRALNEYLPEWVNQLRRAQYDAGWDFAALHALPDPRQADEEWARFRAVFGPRAVVTGL